MTRRPLLAFLCTLGLVPKISNAQGGPKVEPLRLSDADWKKRLAPNQYAVLRQEGTERAGTSPLNDEHRKGMFHCASVKAHSFGAALADPTPEDPALGGAATITLGAKPRTLSADRRNLRVMVLGVMKEDMKEDMVSTGSGRLGSQILSLGASREVHRDKHSDQRSEQRSDQNSDQFGRPEGDFQRPPKPSPLSL